jgi:hypothetical protein
MPRFPSTRRTAFVLVAALGVLMPVAAAATVAPASSMSTAGAPGARAGAGSPDAWSYLMPEHESRWNPCQRIGYRLNLANSPRGTADEVRTALRRVTAESGLRFVYRGTTRIVPGAPGARPYAANTDIVMAWSRPGRTKYLSAGTAGFAGASAYSAVGPDGDQAWALTHGFVVLHQNIYRKLAAGFGRGRTYGYQGTRGQLLMHELGHAVGLGHTNRDTRQSMYPSMSRKLAIWGAGDITGLTMVGADQGCLTTAPAARTQERTMTAAIR